MKDATEGNIHDLNFDINLSLHSESNTAQFFHLINFYIMHDDDYLRKIKAQMSWYSHRLKEYMTVHYHIIVKTKQ